jgi:hypothetical protein
MRPQYLMNNRAYREKENADYELQRACGRPDFGEGGKRVERAL